MTGQELIKFCESKIGTNYVYGMKGVIMTASKYQMLKNMYPTAVWDSDKLKINTVCVDCSGLIQWATGVAGNSSALKTGAKNLYNMSTIDQAPVGAILWKQGHVGVYAGNGLCIEAKGSAYGVVKTKVSSTKWEKWLLLSYIDYSGKNVSSQPNKPQQEGETDKEQQSQVPRYKAGDIVTVTGKLYSNRNGGNSIEKNKAPMQIAQIYNSGKYPIAFVKIGNKTVNGYGDSSVIKGVN